MMLATQARSADSVWSTRSGLSNNKRRKAGEIGRRLAVRDIDQRLEVRQLPEIENRLKQTTRAVLIPLDHSGAETGASDAIAGSLVGEGRTPTAGCDDLA